MDSSMARRGSVLDFNVACDLRFTSGIRLLQIILVVSCAAHEFILQLSEKMSNQRSTSRDDDLLLQDFSRNVTTKSRALFGGNAAVVSAIPLWLFWRIHQMDFLSNLAFFVIGTVASTYVLNLAYQNMKFILKHKIAQKREEAVNREISKIFSNDKNANKKDKDDRVLTRKNEVADFEATTFSIFYNNAFYLVCLIVLSFFVFKNFAPTINYLFSVALSTAVVFLFSTSQK